MDQMQTYMAEYLTPTFCKIQPKQKNNKLFKKKQRSEEEYFEPVKTYKYALEEHFEHKMKLMIKHNNIIYIIKLSCIQE